LVRIAWGITGCGDRIEQITSMMMDLKRKYNFKVDVYVSKSGQMVLRWYKLLDRLKNEFSEIQIEANANAPFLVGKLQTGYYNIFLVAPATANTVAKIAYGIADTLITNAASQATKAMIPVYIYPSDSRKGDVETTLPNGKCIKLRIRDVDVENVNRLRRMESITIIDCLEDIERIVKDLMNNEKSSSASSAHESRQIP
jgi:archaeoflavoprotein AfpA